MGKSQSPAGIFATISTLPYLIATLPAVVKRAERTGFMFVPLVELLTLTHADRRGVVQLPSAVVLSK